MANKFLNVDEKWSVEFDPDNNDRPVAWYRYGKPSVHPWDENNPVLAMFYTLLATSQALRVPTDEECVGKAHSIISYKNGYIRAMNDLNASKGKDDAR